MALGLDSTDQIIAMFRNFLLITFRTLRKNGIYSFINIAGLSVGLVCSILILLWVQDELSWDGFHQKKDQLHRVYLNMDGDQGVSTQMAVALPLWEYFKTQKEIARVVPTNWGQTYLLTVGEKRLYKEGYYAGDEFLKMFSFELVRGNLADQLKDPATIVLTESTAAALFGSEDPIGKTVRVDDKGDLLVTGIVKDVPGNSTFQFECLIPFTYYMNQEAWVKESLDEWDNNSFNLYVEFNKGVDVKAYAKSLEKLVPSHSPENTARPVFLNLSKLRLYSEFKNGESVSGNIIYVRIFTILAIFILVIACINFMNLATARSEKRAREVGIRKSIGSRRIELIFQFLGETFLISLISTVLAVGLVELVLPLYNNLVDKKLFIDYSNYQFWLIGLAVILVTGLAAGSYPALYLSSFQPAAVLKGKMQAGKSGSLPRKLMVTFQFFCSIVLIIGTLVIYLQLSHLQNRPTGYNMDNLVAIPSTGEIQNKYTIIKEELLNKGLAASVTSSSSPITAIYSYNGGMEWKGKREDQLSSFATVAISHDYFKTMGIEFAEGRDYSPDFNDTLSMIVNEAAVAYMGFENPVGETMTWNERTYTIIGVVKNVVMGSPARNVDPLMHPFVPEWMNNVTIRLPEGKSTPETIAEIEKVFRNYNPAYPFSYEFTDDQFNQKFVSIKRIANITNIFSVLAIFISGLGLFGLASFMAEQRTKEIGIRKVLGASVANVVMLMSKDFTGWILVAFAFAAPLSWWTMDNWLQQYTYRIDIYWWIPVISGLSALIVAIGIVSFQAIRAAVANPVNSLRSE